MKARRPGTQKLTAALPPSTDDINTYSQSQSTGLLAICDALRSHIDACLPSATSKMWHGSPVWFIGDNPVVGYSVTAKQVVSLLFWNGQSFNERGMTPVGKGGKAAQVSLTTLAELDTTRLRQWLRKAKTMVLDSRSLYKARLAETKAVKAKAPRPRKRKA